MNTRRQNFSGLSESLYDPKWRGAVYLETIVLAGIVPATALWFDGSRMLNSGFPWFVFIPLLLGLRYGFSAGAGSALLLVAVLASISYLQLGVLPEFPRMQAIGLLLLGMGAGEFHDFWRARLRRLDSQSRHHQARLEQFTRTYHLLRASHTQLERQLGGNVISMRASLQRLKLQQPVADADHEVPLGGIGGWLLEVLAEAGNLHTAALYAVNERGMLQSPAVAMVGDAAELSPFNPLLREAMRTGTIISVHASNEAVPMEVVAVVPLIDVLGRIHGVVSINEMPFIAVHQNTFDLLAVLGGYIGDILTSRARHWSQTQGETAFRYCLERSLESAHKNALPTVLVACKVAECPSQDALANLFCAESRGLDESWICRDRSGHPVTLKILPLTDNIGVQSYLGRLQRLMRKQLGSSMTAEQLISYTWVLGEHHTVEEVLAEICINCDIEAMDASIVEHFELNPEVAS